MSQTQVQTQKICKQYYYRNCIKYSGLTKTIIVLDERVLRPSKVYRSKTGAHGEDIYCLSEAEWQRAWIVTFEQSNSGRRYVSTMNVPEAVKELIEQAWLYEDASIEEIASIIAKLQLQLS